MRAATATAVVVDTEDAQALTALAGRRLVGFSVTEFAGSPDAATIVLRHGTEDTDDPIAWVTLAASENRTIVIGDRGIAVDAGVFVELVDGEVALSLWHTTG